MMTLTTAVSRVASRLNKTASDTTVYNRIRNHINDACLEKWHGYTWSFRHREYPIVLSPRVTSGTMTATNGSQTVTASGTPFLSTHVGAWIRFTGDAVQAWYRVLAVASSSSITIEPAYQGMTGGSKAYEMCKSDHLVPSEVSDIGSLKVTFDGRTIKPEHQFMSDRCDQPPLATGSPLRVSVLNQDSTVGTYSTGTVSGTINTTTLTGVGTAWLVNVVPGDEILIDGDTNTYRVQLVNSDTSITLYNKFVTTASADTYSITRQYGKVLRFWPCPDNPYVLFLKGLRNYSPLINTADTNELLVRYPHAVIEAAIWREASASPDQREDSLFQKSELLWAKAQGEDEAIFPQENFNPIFNPR